MVEKELMLGESGEKALKEVRYCFVQDEDDLPAMPGFMDFMKRSCFCFNFDACSSVDKAMKRYAGEKNFVIYNEAVPFQEAVFADLANKGNPHGFENLILISELRPESLLGKDSKGLVDKVSTVKRTGNIFSIETESGASYFESVGSEA